MTQPANPLSTTTPWNLVADAYASDRLDFFEPFSRDALRLAELPAAPRIADVAAGPGTLSLLAAAQGARVDALDFSAEMLENLRRRVAERGAAVAAVQGDGQDLPWESGAYDGAFSMFGLMFFPDRAAGFRELHRILKPGRRAVVSSWATLVGPFSRVVEQMRAFIPDLPAPSPLPLNDPAELEAEMRAAGFRDVRVHAVRHAQAHPSLREFWDSTQRTAVPLVLLRQKMGAARWAELSPAVYARLAAEWGEGPLESPGLANLAVGVKASAA